MFHFTNEYPTMAMTEKQSARASGNFAEKTPQVAVGALVIQNERVLLVKRAKPPSAGIWALPGGRVHWGESLAQAAEREVIEETGIRVKATKIIYTFDSMTPDEAGNIEYHYVIVDFLAHPVDPDAEPTPADDAADARWIPLNQLKTRPISKPTLALIEQFLPSASQNQILFKEP
jgi:ADP-ribose pyrophosphatase YjhB (NUDIX family)